jgi:hypothetical protein
MAPQGCGTWKQATIAMFDSQTGPIYAVAFAADGTVLTGGDDRTIRDWPATGGDGWCCLPVRRGDRAKRPTLLVQSVIYILTLSICLYIYTFTK